MKPVILFILLSLFFTACGSPGSDVRSEKFQVTVSILPQKYFFERIAGDSANTDFDIHVMIPPGQSPETYAPTPQQMKTVSQSSLYLRIGYIPFETAWMKNIAANNPQMKIIDTSVGVDLIKPGETESHHPGSHPHAGIDPHTWLSVKAVKIQAKHILDAVIALDSENQDIYEKNYRAFLRDIDDLDREIKAILAHCPGKKFLVFHPAWSYFSRDYDLEQVSIEVEGKVPNPADLKRIIDIARAENLRVVFIQAQFDVHSAQAVAEEIRGRLVPLDPLAEDWLANMKQMAAAICESK